MATWTNFASGQWTNSANWTGGVPNAAGAIADLTTVGTGTAFVDLPNGGAITLGVLNIRASASGSYVLQTVNPSVPVFLGSTLIMSNPAGASINASSEGSGTVLPSRIAATRGTKLQLDTATAVLTSGVATKLIIDAPISGAGDLQKIGLGELVLNGANASTGKLIIETGIVTIEDGAAANFGQIAFGLSGGNGTLRGRGSCSSSSPARTRSTSEATAMPASMRCWRAASMTGSAAAISSSATGWTISIWSA